QINYCLDQNWAVAIEFTDDPHPRNTYWNMWGLPMFDLRDPAGVMGELKACREAKPETYIRINAFDSTKGWETVRMSFIVQRPTAEPGFRVIRQETQGRKLRYTIESYAVGRNPEGARYSA
ncbi:MAG TPA: ribulose bisphosphate carboxylase small subunit, partial [Thauera sp.]|nr:ribulose bisphosphate carboxylase small subunit [Thauera sp.]